jgi:hypothetical protein
MSYGTLCAKPLCSLLALVIVFQLHSPRHSRVFIPTLVNSSRRDGDSSESCVLVVELRILIIEVTSIQVVWSSAFALQRALL